VWIWAARDTLLFLVYERLASESPQHIVRIPFAFVQMQVSRYSLCSKLQVILAFLDAQIILYKCIIIFMHLEKPKLCIIISMHLEMPKRLII
jgi:hypothetical protein